MPQLKNMDNMANNGFQKTSATISGRIYPLVLSTEENSIIHEVEKELNQDIREFLASFPTSDVQDSLAFLLLKDRLHQKMENFQDSKDIIEKIQSIENILEENL